MTYVLWILLALAILFMLLIVGAIVSYNLIKRNSRRREKDFLRLESLVTKAKIEYIYKQLNFIYLSAKSNKQFAPIYSDFKGMYDLIENDFNLIFESFEVLRVTSERLFTKKFYEKFKPLLVKAEEWTARADKFINDIDEATKDNQILRTEITYFNQAMRKITNVFENKRTSFGEAENTVAKELNRIKNYLMKKSEEIITNSLSEKDVNVNQMKEKVVYIANVVDRTPEYVAHIYSSIKNKALIIEKEYNKQLKENKSISDANSYKKLLSNFANEYKKTRDCLAKLDIEGIEDGIKRCYLILLNLQESINVENRSKIAFHKVYSITKKTYHNIERNFSRVYSELKSKDDIHERQENQIVEMESSLRRIIKLYEGLEAFVSKKNITYYHKWIKLKQFIQDVYRFSEIINNLYRESFDILNRNKITLNKIKLSKDAISRTMNEIIEIGVNEDPKLNHNYSMISSDLDSIEKTIKSGKDVDQDKLDSVIQRVADFCKKVGYEGATINLAIRLLEFSTARSSTNEILKNAILDSEKKLSEGKYKDAILAIVNQMEVHH